MENLMDGYPVVIEAPVAWGEMDWEGRWTSRPDD